MDEEREGNYYHPGGVPITPQARRFGFEFPVYVSNTVWKECLVWTTYGGKTDARIWAVLQSCYEGLAKALATGDDFLVFYFKHWYDDRARLKATKQKKIKLGARLMLDPEWDSPWLYIFDPVVDKIEELKRGEANESESRRDNECAAGEEEVVSPIEGDTADNDDEYRRGEADS